MKEREKKQNKTKNWNRLEELGHMTTKCNEGRWHSKETLVGKVVKSE